MLQVEQKAEGVVWNTVRAVFPLLPSTVGNFTATRRGGHRQAQRFAAVAKFFSSHKVFQVEGAGRNATQDATPLQKIIGGLRDQQTIWLPDDNLASLR